MTARYFPNPERPDIMKFDIHSRTPKESIVLILFVVNGNSGNGRGSKIWTIAEQRLKREKIAYGAIAAESAEASLRLTVEQLARGDVKAVAAIGGDGTVHGLLPLLAGSGIPLGLIPSGSGNDTSRALGIPRDPSRALDIVLAGRTRRIDLLETASADSGKQPTLTAVAIGLDAAVAADVDASRYKRWCNKLGLGSLAYIIGLLRTLAAFKPGPVTVTVDGVAHSFGRGWLAAVTNGPSYGGGLRICPSAKPDDGKLHVCVVHGCGPWKLLAIFPTLLFGKHVGLTRYVAMLSGREAAVSAGSPLLAYGDGEPAGSTPVSVAIRSGQLDFLISDNLISASG